MRSPDTAGDLPPQDLDAERSVLGAMLLSADAVADVIEIIDGGDFYKPAHETIHDTALAMFNRGEPVDALTVADALRRAGRLDNVGGAIYLHDLIAAVPSVASASHYARIVADLATIRRLRTAAQRILNATDNPDGAGVEELVNAAQAEVFAVTEERSKHDYIHLSNALESTLGAIGAAGTHGDLLPGVPTGYSDLDRLTGGLRPAQLVVVAARPAIGKSIVALDIARHAAIRAGVPTVVFTLEMDAAQVTTRILSAETTVPLTTLDRGDLNPDQWTRVAKHSAELANAPLWIDDSPNLTLAQIRAKARRLRQQHDLGLIVVDYLQLLNAQRRTDRREEQVAEFSRGLKLLAKELHLPVVALSQLNRGVEQRAEKRPMLSDMRESGAIEQDADLVLFVHRDDAYDRDLRPGEADLILAKHRGGPTDTVTVAFRKDYVHFTNMGGM